MEVVVHVVQFNVLDYAVIDEGKSAEEALQDTVHLAQLADKLGYKLFWLTEHHNVPAFACSSPELLMMQILNKTQNIALGSGGVMLPHYIPYKVAENFRMLAALHPERVDLGIGNNAGTAQVKAAMNETKSHFLDYGQSIEDVRHYLTEQQTQQRHHRVVAQPSTTFIPSMWLLSTSVASAKKAGAQGMGYTLGTFLLPNAKAIDKAKDSVKMYRDAFQPSSLNMVPSVMITVFIALADSAEEAETLAQSLDIWLLGKEQFAEFERMPSPETAQSYHCTEKDERQIAQSRARIIVGTKESAKPQIDRMIQDFNADEVMVVPLIPSIEARCRAVELLAEIYL